MKLNITIDGKTYEIEVEASEPEQSGPVPGALGVNPGAPSLRVPAGTPPALFPTAAPAPVKEEKVCRSPVTGIVVRLAAQVGQSIQANDVLVVLEAMKMETSITAPSAGKVAAIRVKQGDAVKSGQVVVEFE